MKHRIDDMVQDIQSDEVLQMDGKLEQEQQKRIEEMILSAITGERKSLSGISKLRTDPSKEPNTSSYEGKNSPIISDEQENSFSTHKNRKLNHRKLLTFLFAAALVIAFAVTAGAAANHDWDVAIVNFMGISDADTVQLPDGNIQIGASAVCYGTDYSSHTEGEEKSVHLTATSSVGDKNAAYIRFDTDYELPEDFDPEHDYVLPENMDLSVSLKNPDKGTVESDRGSIFTSMEEDGKLIFMLYVSDCKKINKSYVSINMENLYLYHDHEITGDTVSKVPELLYEGSWSLDWKYSYRSNVKTKRMLKSVEKDGVRCFLTHMEVTPLGIRFEGFVNPLIRMDTPVCPDVDSVTFKDGRVLTAGGCSDTGLKNGFLLEGYCGIDGLGEALDVDEVESITINGCEISL